MSTLSLYISRWAQKQETRLLHRGWVKWVAVCTQAVEQGRHSLQQVAQQERQQERQQ